MSTIVNEVRRGFFLDSVALMRISRNVAELPGVEEAALMMGTPANKGIMSDAGLMATEGEAATGGDLILGIRATDTSAAATALATAAHFLTAPKRRGVSTSLWHPRSVRAAVAAHPEGNLALISVPGDFAAAEARKSLRRGLNVMIFSNNVTIEDELSLKQEARERGLFVMGPDCGTAIIGGVPLAFANVVARGDIGIIGASGTGMQEVSCLISQSGGGVSHAIGVGGRDLSETIGGITSLMAIDTLEADPGTRHIVVISKPPSPSVVAKLLARIVESSKSFTLCLIGGDPIDLPKNAMQVATLKEAAASAAPRIGLSDWDVTAIAKPLPAGRPLVKGLFCGGTLTAEAQVVFRAAGESVVSNAPLPGVTPLSGDTQGHAMIDLGADEFTRGRPHPMIDPTVRDDVLAQALTEPDTGLILLDVVLGYGSHEDPAGHVARCLETATAERPLVIASVTGTDDDPQNRKAQVAVLEAASILVAPTNADAAALALACLRLGR
jgi:succinyl-CoA synthetase alpha subunit